MKKQLLTTTAAIAMVGGAATAQEWDVRVGGYYNTYVGISSISGTADNLGGPLFGTDFDGVQIQKDAEVHVVPSITLDNGLTFGANIQYETARAPATDEVYIFISGDSLGTIEIGSENSAGYKMSIGAPSVGGVPINSGSVSGFVPFVTSGAASSPAGVGIVNSFVGAGYSSYVEVGGALYGNSDIQRISYYTPSFNGFKVGVSYAPGTASGVDGASGIVDRSTSTLSDVFDIGLSYDQTFGSTSVSLSARWGTADIATGATAFGLPVTSDPEAWAIGAQVGFGDFTIGGSYAENDNGVTGGTGDEEGWTFGATYDLAGPWRIGFEYLHGEGDHGLAGAGTKDEMDIYKLAASRDLGPGVTWAVSLLYTEVDAADAALGGLLGGATGTDLKATTLSTSISLSF